MNKYLKTSSILLVGFKPSHRSGLRKMLVDIGADNRLIEASPDFEQACTRLSGDSVNIIISDDEFEDRGQIFELIKMHRKNTPVSAQRLFILTASASHDFFSSEFLMKGGDLIVPKPYTIGSFTEAFNEVVAARAALSRDEKTALSVEDSLRINDRQAAGEFLKAIKNLQSRPGFYSQGMISQYDKDFFNAFTHFVSSLEHKVDLKGLVSVVSTGVKTKKFNELDSFVETWIKEYPLLSESITDITRVVLYNKKFHLLKEMKVEDQLARIPMAAGMVVASSYYLDRGEMKLSIEYAKRAIDISGPKKNIITRGFEILVKAGAMVDAVKIFESAKFQSNVQQDLSLVQSLKSMLQLKA